MRIWTKTQAIPFCQFEFKSAIVNLNRIFTSFKRFFNENLLEC